ncbi:MAG TPA: methyltransferase domain-containing protein [Thermoanaerobaculia bacterium]|nr:methyltransferase domain-containing protein [Thermoanaerobaculia bacterium]
MPFARVARRWLRLPEPFRARHFRRREAWRPDYQIVAAALLERLEFTSALDVGCANGFLLEAFLAAGKRVAGIEVSPQVREVLPPALQEVVVIGDFTRASGAWDLVCCVEVAEHLPPRRSEPLVATLAAAGERWIYFTAAAPGQRGRGHINCRPHAEWQAMFRGHGWVLDEAATARLRESLQGLRQATWLRANSLLLRPADQVG